MRRHVGEVQTGDGRSNLVDHPLQSRRLRGFKRRVEHPARIRHPRRFQEPPAQRQRQFRLAHAGVPRQVHYRVRLQRPFQLPQFRLPSHQAILSSYRNLQVFGGSLLGMDHRRRQRVRLDLRDHRRLVLPRLVDARQLPIPENAPSVQRDPLRRIHQRAAHGGHRLRYRIALCYAAVECGHCPFRCIRMQRSRQHRNLSHARFCQRHASFSPLR